MMNIPTQPARKGALVTVPIDMPAFGMIIPPVPETMKIGMWLPTLWTGADMRTVNVRQALPGQAVDGVVDTSGGGDAFNDEYLAWRVCGSIPADAARAGPRVVARVVTHDGALVPATVLHRFLSPSP